MHVPGTKMIQSDALSRWPGYNQTEEEERITMLPENTFGHDLDPVMKPSVFSLFAY